MDSSISKQILLIEDDADIRDTLKEILEYEGYDVRSAKNGQEGIDYLRQFPAPALILLDFMMPIMNGWQFRAIQKEDPEFSKIPVIVLSADNAAYRKAGEIGVQGFLRK